MDSHGDRIRAAARLLGEGHVGERAVRSDRDEKRRFYGLMFHPEVIPHPDGARLIANFVRNIARLPGDWTMAEFQARGNRAYPREVGRGKVICGLSGGVDSAWRRC